MIRGKMSKKAHKKGNNEIEVEKYYFRENNTPKQNILYNLTDS